MSVRSAILGTGSFLPERVLDNHELSTMVDTSDDWIVSRTGIRERRIAHKEQAASDLAVVAGARYGTLIARRSIAAVMG